ncbi:TPA: hypothetical protein ACYLM8_008978, partial [Burkholderia lata]
AKSRLVCIAIPNALPASEPRAVIPGEPFARVLPVCRPLDGNPTGQPSRLAVPPLPDKKSRIRSESAYAGTNRAVTPPVSTFFEMNHRILPTMHSHKQRDHLRK